MYNNPTAFPVVVLGHGLGADRFLDSHNVPLEISLQITASSAPITLQSSPTLTGSIHKLERGCVNLFSMTSFGILVVARREPEQVASRTAAAGGHVSRLIKGPTKRGSANHRHRLPRAGEFVQFKICYWTTLIKPQVNFISISVT